MKFHTRFACPSWLVAPSNDVSNVLASPGVSRLMQYSIKSVGILLERLARLAVTAAAVSAVDGERIEPLWTPGVD